MKKKLIFFKKILLGLIIINFLAGCTTSIVKPKKIEYDSNTTIAEDSLRKLVTCENVDINGKETSRNGKVSAEVQIRIINGKNLPADEMELKGLGKAIASLFKHFITNSNEFDSYQVLFVDQKVNGGATESDYKGWSYKASEL